MMSAPFEQSPQGLSSSPEEASRNGTKLPKRADANSADIISWLEDLQKHRLSQQTEINKQQQELEMIKRTQPTGPLHEQQLRRKLVTAEQRVEELESAVTRGATLLEATWSRYESLRRRSVVAEDHANILGGEMRFKDALIATDFGIIELVPDLLNHFANKKAKRGQTVQISDDSIQRVKNLLAGRPAQVNDATVDTPTPQEHHGNGQRKAQATSTDMTEVAIDGIEKGKERAVDVDEGVQSMTNTNDSLPTNMPYRLTLYTLDPAVLTSPDFNSRTCIPQFRSSRIVSTTKVQDGKQVMAVVLNIDKEMNLGIRKYDMFFKLENIDLHTIVSYDLVEPGDEDGPLRRWTQRIAEEGIRGRGEELRELKVYAFPEEKTLEAMGAIIMCHEA